MKTDDPRSIRGRVLAHAGLTPEHAAIVEGLDRTLGDKAAAVKYVRTIRSNAERDPDTGRYIER